ncbi:ArsR family transcriptional regulator [Candidatus Nanosalina sp. VS9-1]|uniref:HVO_A0114 family putative DNA-binding protein n=1 Tax=Candidatus Nanosalina sp. VS9-1 TaxID=3388566 RepID=UPI0039E0D369
MEYSSKKENKEKKLNDVKTDLKGTELDIGKEIREVEQKISESEEKIPNFSESEIEEKFKETEKKTVILKFSIAQKLLTEKRRELLQTLSEQEFDSITELTEELGRDKKNTSQDIKKLYQHGIIDLKDQGRSKEPVFEFEEIQIEGLEFEENQN